MPNNFIKGNNSIINKSIDIANEFIDFFVNIGNNLTNEIKEQTDGTGRMNIGDSIHCSFHSIFIQEVGETEVNDIVKKIV